MKAQIRSVNILMFGLLIWATTKKRAKELSNAQLVADLFPNFWAAKLTLEKNKKIFRKEIQKMLET